MIGGGMIFLRLTDAESGAENAINVEHVISIEAHATIRNRSYVHTPRMTTVVDLAVSEVLGLMDDLLARVEEP